MAVSKRISHHTTCGSGEFEGLCDNVKAEMNDTTLEDTADGPVFGQELGAR